MSDADRILSRLGKPLDLALPAAAAPAPPERPRLKAKMTTLAALCAIAGHCVDVMVFHAPSVRRRGDIEDVHRLRVAVRRLRAVLSIFRRALGGDRVAFEADLRWLQDQLGAVRDWDVLRQQAIQPLLNNKEGLNDKQGAKIEPVDEAGAAARDDSYRDLCAALDSPRCAALWLDLAEWQDDPAASFSAQRRLNGPAKKYARRELRRRARKLRRRGRHIAALDEAELHKLRIGAKKLRYAVEFFGDLVDRRKRRKTVRRLGDLQDQLGGMNDSRTAQRLLERLATLPSAALRSGPDTAIPRALGAGLVEGSVLARSKAGRRQLERCWERYERAAKVFLD